MKPHVAIAIPSFRDWKPQAGVCMAGLAAKSVSLGINVTVMSVQESPLVSARNRLVRRAQNIGVSHVLFVDDDMTFPPEMLHTLLRHDVDAVGVQYPKRAAPYGIVGRLMTCGGGLQEAIEIGGAILLIRMAAFSHLRYPWFQHTWSADGEVSEDYYFSREMRNAGLKLWCDTDLSLRIGHLGDEMFSIGPNGEGGPMNRVNNVFGS